MMEGVRTSAVAAALIFVAIAATPVAAQVIPTDCETPPVLLTDESPLPNALLSIRRQKSLKVVVLGSASSLGSGATGPDASWPKRLEVHLGQRLPGTAVQVVNRSVAGQGIQKMVDRLRGDVIAEKPSLVIWQTGTSEAVRAVDPDQFMSTLIDGVDQMALARIDVVLMDPQYSRLTARIINFQPYVDAMTTVAGMRDLVLVPRYAIMRYWIESGQLDFADLPRAEAAKVADQIYDCIGRIAAKVISAKLK
jgi:acyl-CoA thioesterase I